ncbi:MAG: hypothetical protein QXS37_05160 [Candidatus Aenigmatarchaeota archaeon]
MRKPEISKTLLPKILLPKILLIVFKIFLSILVLFASVVPSTVLLSWFSNSNGLLIRTGIFLCFILVSGISFLIFLILLVLIWFR